MGKALALALLLVQLQPLVGAAVCLHAAAQHREECDMPPQGGPPASQESERSVPPDCARMAICAPAGLVMPQAALRLVDTTPPTHPEYSTPSLLFPGERIAPPEPPPIA